MAIRRQQTEQRALALVVQFPADTPPALRDSLQRAFADIEAAINAVKGWSAGAPAASVYLTDAGTGSVVRLRVNNGLVEIV